MKGLILSFQPLLSKYKLEAIILSLAFLMSLGSIFVFVISSKNNSSDSTYEEVFRQQLKSSQKILVEISGAVIKPDVYELSPGARIKDILTMAGGFSSDADRTFFSHNFNLARILNDQDKIYIPTIEEIYSGTFLENRRTLDYIQPQKLSVNPTSYPAKSKQININTATVDELDILPSIGKSTAQKIVQNRPYSSLDQLVSKKIIKPNVFNAMKDFIHL